MSSVRAVQIGCGDRAAESDSFYKCMSTTNCDVFCEARQIEENDFVIVDGYFVTDRTLSLEARFLGLLLQTFVTPQGPTRFPSVHHLRFSSGWSNSTLRKYQAELESRGWLQVLLLRDGRGRTVKCFTVGYQK